MAATAGFASNPKRARRRWKTALTVGLLCAVGFLLIKLLLPQTIGEQARRVFEKQLASHYDQWNVSIGRGVYKPGIGLRFESIRFNPKEDVAGTLAAWWSGQDTLKIESLDVLADMDPGKLLEDKSPLKTNRIIIRGVKTHLHVTADGQHNLASLWPPPQLGPVCPQIDLHDVTILASSETAPQERPLRFHLTDVSMANDCTVLPKVTAEQFAAIHNGLQDAQSVLPQSRRKLRITGDSEIAKAFDVEVVQELTGGQLQSSVYRGKVSSLQFTSPLLMRFAQFLPNAWKQTPQFRFTSDLQWHVAQRAAGLPHAYKLVAKIRDGFVQDARLSEKVEGLRGTLEVVPGTIRVKSCEALFGKSPVQVSGETEFEWLQIPGAKLAGSRVQDSAMTTFRWGPCRAHLRAENFAINQRLTQTLPLKTRNLCQRWQPSGQIHFIADVANQHLLNPKTWQVDASVYCAGVDVRFDKFPLPISAAVGNIVIADGRATAQAIQGRVGNTRIECDFDIPVHLNPDQPRQLDKTVFLRGEGPIAIDEPLVSALTPLPDDDSFAGPSTLESFVRSLNPRGSIALGSATIQTNKAGVTNRQFDLQVTDGSLHYSKFPYPLYNVNGRIQVQDDLVRIIGFTANNAGAARIACDGLYRMPSHPEAAATPSRLPPLVNQSQSVYSVALARKVNRVPASPQPEIPSQLDLRFRVADIAMDQSLRRSIPESSRGIWDSLSPAGTLDRLDVKIHQSGQQPIDLMLTAEQLETDVVTVKSLNIRPTAIPYRLDIVGGKVAYQNNEVRIADLRARHDGSHVIADGGATNHASGRWLLSLDLHSGCRVVPDEELNAAVPDELSQALRALDLRGPVRFRGHTNVLLPATQTDSPIFDWSLGLQLEGNRIADVGPVHSLRGEILVNGYKNNQTLRASGDIQMDSMHAYGLHLTGIRGPFSVDGDQLRFGALSRPGQSTAGQDNPNVRSQVAASPNQRAGVGPTNDSRPRPIVGQLFGGIVDASGTMQFSTGDFDANISVSNAQIATALAEIGQTRTGMKGRLDLNSQVEGRMGDLDLLKGSGSGRISDANLYQLPYLVQVLNLLRITPTEDVAFTDGETEFTIFGEDLNFNRLTLWGDLVALDGGGTLSRREHLDLSFNTRVSPQNLFSKVLSPIRDDRYTFWTIEVDGPISAPTIQRRALSGIGRAMEDWFPGMVRSTTADTSAVKR